MTADKFDILHWFDSGVAMGATHMLVVCDTFDREEYPVYVGPAGSDIAVTPINKDLKKTIDKYDGKNMQTIHEIYDLREDKQEQINAERVWNANE